MECRRFLLLGICLSLAGCYYIKDIQNQTIGSFAGGMGPGIILAKSGAALMSIGTGIVGGSIIGSMFGQYFDDYDPLVMENPLTSPVHRYSYQMLRPNLDIDCFTTGKIYYNYSDHLPYLALVSPTENTLDPVNGVAVCQPKIS